MPGLRLATLLKKSLWYSCFPLNFAKFLRIPFFTEHLWWLLLRVDSTLDKTLIYIFYITEVKYINHNAKKHKKCSSMPAKPVTKQKRKSNF